MRKKPKRKDPAPETETRPLIVSTAMLREARASVALDREQTHSEASVIQDQIDRLKVEARRLREDIDAIIHIVGIRAAVDSRNSLLAETTRLNFLESHLSGSYFKKPGDFRLAAKKKRSRR